MFVTNTGLGVAVSNWCNTWLEQSPWHDSGLFRITFAADPPSATTATGLLRHADSLHVARPDQTRRRPESEVLQQGKGICHYNFSLPGNVSLVVLWLPGKSVDTHPGVKTDLWVERVWAKRSSESTFSTVSSRNLFLRRMRKGPASRVSWSATTP